MTVRTDYANLVRTMKPWLIHIRFEQGRGAGGVPNAFLALYPGSINGGEKTATIETLTRLAVAHMRAICADPNIGHGEDLMPADDEQYELHHVQGAKVEKIEDLRFETRADGLIVSELVLTWGTPARHLMDELKES